MDSSPILTTTRLTLREMGPADAPFLWALMVEPAYIRNIGDKGLRTTADAAAYIAERFVASYDRYGFGLYRVALRETDVPVGICGLVKRDSLDDVDLGFAFLAAHRRQGYAREASAAVMAFARDHLGLQCLAAITLPDNEPSLRLLASLGFRPHGLLPGSTSDAPLQLLQWQATSDPGAIA